MNLNLFIMALTTVSVYKKVFANNSASASNLLTTPTIEGFETTKVVWFGPSICNDGTGVNSAAAAINAKIVIAGGTNDKYSRITLYTSSTVAQIAALT